MKTALVWMYIRSWGRNLWSVHTGSSLLSSFGALWLLVEITRFFFANTKVPDVIRSLWYVFGLIGLLIALYLCRPHLCISHRLNCRDVVIQIAIGDVFAYPGALIVGSNSTFDTRISRELISEQSVQGVFTKRYYGDEMQLDAEISVALGSEKGTPINGRRVGKAVAYPMGTVVRLNPRERTAYFLAIADINSHGVASGTFDGLKDALAKLWQFVGSRGLKDELVMPVLGTGFSRLSQTREEIVRETVRSFVAACAERTFCSKLTIVLSPRDVEEHHISLDELGQFVRHVCVYSEFVSVPGIPVGTEA